MPFRGRRHVRRLGLAPRPAACKSGGAPPCLARLFDPNQALSELGAPERHGNSGHGNRRRPRPFQPPLRTIYVIRGYSSPPPDFKIRRSLDGGRSFGDPLPVDLCSAFNNTTCDVGRPGIAVGNGGGAYNVDPNLAAGGVAGFRSVDHGLSWVPGVVFTGFGGGVSIGTGAATGGGVGGGVDAS